MNDAFQDVIEAILGDDCSKMTKFLVWDTTLAGIWVANADQFEPRIAHWIYRGDTALHIASAGHRVSHAKLLIGAGAELSAPNRRRAQPLHYAADGQPNSPVWNPNHQSALIRLLVAQGACPNARDSNGATPLHRAVRTRCASAVKCLLTLGADATLRNRAGSTPFHLAVQNTGRGGSGSDATRTAQRQIIDAFLEHGVSPTIQDKRGRSVTDWVVSEWIQDALRPVANPMQL